MCYIILRYFVSPKLDLRTCLFVFLQQKAQKLYFCQM